MLLALPISFPPVGDKCKLHIRNIQHADIKFKWFP